jgi:tetratricopeptide (TPR) repeat protein
LECLTERVATSVLASLVLVALSAYATDCNQETYQCAREHVEKQQFSRAVPILEQLVKRSPRDFRAVNLLGVALSGTGQMEKANLQYRRALNLNPRFYLAIRNLAVNELLMGRRKEAKTHFEQVLKFSPADDVAHVSLAEMAFEQKQCGPALEHYERSRPRIVTNPLLILHYSECSIEQGHSREAVAMLDLLPGDAYDAQFQAGVVLEEAEVYAESARHFGLARKGYADPYSAGYNQILACLRAGDSTSALNIGNELLAAGYQKAELYSLMAEAYLKQKQIKEAYGALRTAASLDPNDEDNYLDIGIICSDYQNYDLGLEVTEIGLRQIPNSDRLHLQRGLLRMLKGNDAEAEEDVYRAAKMAPQKGLPYAVLGIIWMKTGQLDKAVKVLRERARQTPEDYLVQYMFGMALLRSGFAPGSPAEDEALAAFGASVRLKPDFAHSRTELGKLLLKRGEVDRAIDQLEKGMKLDPTDSAAVYQLASAYRRKGAVKKAEELESHLKTVHDEGLKDEIAKQMIHIIRESTP